MRVDDVIHEWLAPTLLDRRVADVRVAGRHTPIRERGWSRFPVVHPEDLTPDTWGALTCLGPPSVTALDVACGALSHDGVLALLIRPWVVSPGSLRRWLDARFTRHILHGIFPDPRAMEEATGLGRLAPSLGTLSPRLLARLLELRGLDQFLVGARKLDRALWLLSVASQPRRGADTSTP